MNKKSLVALALVFLSAAACALPTTQEVEAAVQKGQYREAESMMSEVVAAKPDSAKAHYVYAEMLAHNRQFAKAGEEAARARQLDPTVKFTTTEKFSAFEQLLQREQSAEHARPPAPSALTVRPAASSSISAVPVWVWAIGLAGIGFLLWRGFARSRGVPPASTAVVAGSSLNPSDAGALPGTPAATPGVLPNTGAVAGPAPGSGMLGTGMAVAGGVAGGLLLGELLHNHAGAARAPDRLMSSADPVAANDSAKELEQRPVDFGNGDGDWDGGGAADSGGSDGGGWD